MSAKMCLTLIFLCSVSLLVSTEYDKHRVCKLPAYPTDGSYITNITDASPGVEAASLIIYYVCSPGYELIGPRRVSCDKGVWSEIPHYPQCVPHCSIENETHVVTCAVKEYRCVIPEDFGKSIHLRTSVNKNEYQACGMPYVASTIISGGTVALFREIPWHAAIYTKTTKPYMQICGGSLITKSFVISAAHCFWNDVYKLLPAENYAVALGKINRPWNDEPEHSQRSDVREIKVPPRYYGAATNFQDDIALVRLTTPVDYTYEVQPVCLDFDHVFENRQLVDGKLGKVAGWGLTSEDGRASQVLKTVDLPYVDVRRCIQGSPPQFLSSITGDKICAGYKNGTSVCKGDSGGGLVFIGDGSSGPQRYFLRGLVSAAPSDEHLCNTHAWGTFTLVSKHERFIKDNVLDL